MVLTTVPTTALTVHAEDQSVIVDTGDSKPADGQSGSDETGNQNDLPGDSNSEPSGDGSTGDTSVGTGDGTGGGTGDSTITDGGNTDGTGEGSGEGTGDSTVGTGDGTGTGEGTGDGTGANGGDEGQIPPADNTNTDDAGSDEELTDKIEPAGDVEEITPFVDETAKPVKVSLAQIVYNEAGTSITGYEDLTDADVVFEGQTVDDDFTADPDKANILFKVTPDDGKMIKEVKFATAENEEDFAFDKKPALKGVRGTVSPSSPNEELAVTDKTKDLSDKGRIVRIFVGVTDVTYTVSIPRVGGHGAFQKTGDPAAYDFTTDADINKTGLKYGESFTFAVKQWTKPEDVTLTAKASTTADVEASKLVLSPVEKTQGETKYLEYTLNPLDVAGILRTNTDTVTVTITPTPDTAVTVDSTHGIKLTAIPDATPARNAFDFAAVKAAAGLGENYKDLSNVAAGSANSYTTKQKVVFAVEQKDDMYNLIPPTAYWVYNGVSEAAGSEKDEDKNEIAVNKRTAENGTEYYEIDLAEITKAARLYVQIEGDLDDTSEYVKTVAFKGDGHVKAAAGSDTAPTGSNNILGKSMKTDAADYVFTVKADTGYAVTDIEFVTEKIYEDGSTATETTKRSETGAKLAADAKLDPFSTQEDITVPFSGVDEVEGQADKSWKSKKVSVNITTGVQTSKTDKIVTFVSQGNYTDKTKGAYLYKVTTVADKVIQDANEKEKFAVKAGTDYLEFNVQAETKPVIEVGTDASVAELVEGGEGFTYRIPAVSLGNEATVWIKRAPKKIHINYNDPAATASAGAIEVNVEDADASVAFTQSSGLTNATTGLKEGYDHQLKNDAINADAKIAVTVKTTGQAPITAVNYQVKGGSVKSAEYNADTKKWEFEVKATDDVDVDVVKSSDKKLVLTTVGGELTAEDGVYSVSYKDEIVAKVYNGETPLALYSTNVKTEEGKNAKTAAVIDKTDSSQSAKIKVVEKEYGETLTVTLVTLDDKTPVSFKIKTETPVDGVTYENDKLADGKIVLPVDTQTEVKVNMSAKNAKVENLRVALINATAKTIGGSATTLNGVTITGGDELVDGAFTIKADAVSNGKKNSNAAKVVLYDVNDTKKTIIAGSEILVNTADATVLEKAPTLSPGTPSAKTIRVNITSPEGVEEDLVAGDVWYKIEVTKPKSLTGLSDAAKSALNRRFTGNTITETVKKSQVDAEGGYAFRVFDQKYANKEGQLVDFPGEAVSGFGVKVTLVQTTTKNQADAATSTIKGTTESIELGTQGPSYEESKTGKLKLKKGQTTLYTGNTNWVAVATPEFASAKYGAVETEFVDTKTGKVKYPSGMSADYNNVTNQVVVKFDDKNGYYAANARGDYKDLAVRVKATTEDTGYGVSGDMKLTIVNGIESINASVQPYVKKEAGKAATFNVEADLNNSSLTKAWAPKNKKVTYSIVGTSVAVDANYNVTNAATKLSAYVTVKGDKITVAKDYPVSKTKADNQFKILATAVDYEGNTYKELLATTVEITSESQPMGSLQVMKNEGNGKYTLAGTTLTVRDKMVSDEYKLVVLKPNVAADRASYKAADFAPAGSFTFTPNKAKGSVVVDTDGEITVNKLGKATLAAVDKSDKKNKKELKVEFVQTAAPLELEISKYEGSALNSVQYKYYDSFEFSGNNNTLFGINVVEKVKDGYKAVNLSDAKVSVKNAKIVTPKDDEWAKLGIGAEHRRQYVIAPTGNPVTVTLKSKKATKTYTINNLAYKSGRSSIKVNAADKTKVVAGEINQPLSFKVEGKDIDLEGRYVMLSVDNTKKSPIDASHAFVQRVSWYASPTRTYTDCALALRDEGMFDLKISPANAGTYNLNVAVGTLNGGIFTQEYPDVKLAVKVAKKGNVNLKVAGTYTLDPNLASVADIQYNSKDAKAYFVNDPVDGNYAMNAIIGDQENRFRDYFEAKINEKDGTIGTIGLRSDLDDKKLAEITSDPKNPNLTGYISVQNYSKRVDVKITIKFKEAKKLTAKCNPVLAGSDVTVDVVLMNGKERVPVKDFTVDGTEFKRDNNDVFANPIWNAAKTEVIGGDIRLKGTNIAEGKKTVTVHIMPLNTPGYRQDKKYAIPVELTINVLKNDAKNKVVIAKGQNNWIVESWNYEGPDDKKVHPQGSWQGYVEYNFKNALSVKEGTKINVTRGEKDPDFISFVSDDYSVYNDFQVLTPIIDKEKLAAAVASDGKKIAWGKKINVTANFTYGDAKNPTTLVKDSAKLSITLPKQPGAELTDGKAFEAAEASIRNTIATMTDYYNGVREAGEDWNIYNDDIRDRIKGSLLYAADGATVTVTVTHSQGANNPGTAMATWYKATVKDASGKTIYGEKTFNVVDKSALSATIVRNNISSLGATNWALTGVTDESLTGTVLPDVKTVAELQAEIKKRLTADISGAEYARLIHDILVKTGKTDDRFGISVKITAVTAPKVGAAGSLTADIRVTDQSVAPTDGLRNEKWYADLLDLTYTLPEVQAVGAIGTAGSALASVNTTLTTGTEIEKLVGDAWKSTAKVGDTWENEEFQSKLQEAIVAKANEIIAKGGDGSKTGNPNLKATGIEKDTFVLKMVANSTINYKVDEISYNLLLTDSTPGAENQNLEIPVNVTTDTNGISAFMTEAGLQAEILKKENRVIASAATKEAAYALVKAKITKLAAVNPALNLSDLEVTEAESKVFTAPKNKNNGIVDVHVTINDNDANKFDVTNIVILAEGEDFKGTGDTDEEVAAAKEKARVTSIVQSALSKENISKLIKDTYVAWTKLDQGNMGDSDINIVGASASDNIKGLLAEKVSAALTAAGSNYELKESTKADNIPTVTFAAPTSSTNRMNIPAFTVLLKDGDGNAVDPINIKAMTLDPMPEFQSMDEIKTKLSGNVLMTRELTVRNVDLETGATNTDGALTGVTDTAKTALGNAVLEVLNNAGIVTGLRYELVCTKDNGPGASAAYTKLATGAAYQVTGWDVYVKDKSAAAITATDKVAIAKITVKTAAATPSVSGIRFGKVDEHTVTYIGNTGATIDTADGNGSSNATDKPIAVGINESHDYFEVSIDKVLQNELAETNGYGQKITWKVTKGDGTDLDSTGNVNKITCEGSDTSARITVPGEVFSADRTVALKITATSDGKKADGTACEASIYVKLTLKPYVSEFTIEPNTAGTGEFIEVGSDGKNANGVAYKAVLKGMYLNTADKAGNISWSVVDNTTNHGQVSPTTGTSTTLKFNDTNGVPAATTQVTLKAALSTPNNYDGTKEAEKPVAIRRVGDTAELKVVLGDADGVEYSEMLDPDTTDANPALPKIIVTGKSVKIPLSVEGDNTTRAWTYTVKNASGNSALADPYDTIVVQPATATSKTAYLVIPNVDEIADEVLNADGTAVATPAELKIVIGATSAASGALSAKTAESYTAGLVVKKSVTGIKLFERSAADGTEKSTDTGKGEISATAGTNVKVYVNTELVGSHIKAAEVKNVTYKITDRSANMKAAALDKTKLADGDNNAAAITLSLPNNEAGFVEITATYGTGSDKVTASRVVNVASGTTYAVTKASAPETGCTSADGAEITIDKAHSADPTVTYEVSGQTPTWTLINVDEAIKDYVSINASGVVTINSDPAGYGEDKPALAATTTPYHFTVKASFTDAVSGTMYSRTKNVTLKINRVIKTITAGTSTGSTGITIGGTDDALTVTKEVAGTITIPISYTGDRTGTATAHDLLTYSVAYDGTAANVTTVSNQAIPEDGKIVVTINTDGAENGKKITVTINAKSASGLTGLQTAKTIVFTAG